MLPGERGQSVQIGAVLLFAVVVLLLALHQAVLVPDQNRQVEFDHNEQVTSDLGDLRNALVSAVGDATSQSVSVRTGTSFPERIVAVNPASPSGTLRTAGTADGDVNVTLENATALDGETADFWTGDPRAFGTGSIVYRPEYSEYERPPTTIYEHSVLFDRFDDADLPRSGQAFVDGRRISLVTVNGTLSTTRDDALSVDVDPISASTNAVTITNETGRDSNVTIRTPTRLSENTWEDLLEDETVEAGGHVLDVDTRSLAVENRDLLVVELEGDVDYTLRMGKAGVGTRTGEEDATYLTDVRGNGSTVYDEGSQQLTVELRDRYNNPVSGVPVGAAANGTGDLDDGNLTTDDSGRATFRYEAPDAADLEGALRSARVNATIESDVTPGESPFDRSTPENITFDLTVRNTAENGDSGGDNGGAFGVSVDSADSSIAQGETFVVDATVANTGSENATEKVSLDLDGATADSEFVALDPGESTQVRLTEPDTDGLSGSLPFAVRTADDEESGTVTVVEPAGSHFDARIEDTNAPVVEGETLSVPARVENVGNESDAQTVALTAGGNAADSESVSLGPGETTTITLTYDSSIGDRGDLEVVAETADDDDRRTVTVEKATPDFDVGIAGTNSPVGVGDSLDVTVDVENTGDAPAQQRISMDFRDDGSIDDRQFVTLDPGESTQITLDSGTPSSLAPGDYDVAVASENATATDTVVLERRSALFDVFVTDTNAPIGAGERLDVTAEVTNTGDATAEQKVTLDFREDGTVEDREFVTLDPGEERTITLSHTTDESLGAGEYDAAVASANTSHSTAVGIDSPPYFDVRDVTSPDPVVEGETATVDATVENTGGAGTQTVELEIESVGTVSTQVALDAGEEKTVTLSTGTRDGDAGDGLDLIVRSEDDAFTSRSIDVLEDASFDVSIGDTNDPVSETGTLEVTASVSNAGAVEGTKDVTLAFDGTTVDSVPVTLAAGDGTDVTLGYEIQKGDAGTVPIAAATEDADDSRTVEVLPLGWINGTVFDPETADEKRVEGVTVELLDGDDNVVETHTTGADGSYAFEVPRGDYTVDFDGGSVGYGTDQTDVTLQAGGEEHVDTNLQAYSVFAFSTNGIGNKGTINANVTVARTDGTESDLSVYVDAAAGNNGYNAKTVTINGTTYALTEDAADRIASQQQVDLFDEANYEPLVNGDLDAYNGAIPESAGTTVQNYGDEDLSATVRLKS